MENTEELPLRSACNGIIITEVEDLTPFGFAKIILSVQHDSIFPHVCRDSDLKAAIKNNARPLIFTPFRSEPAIRTALSDLLYANERPAPVIRSLSRVLEEIRAVKYDTRTAREQNLDQEVDFWLVWSPQGTHPPRFQHTSLESAEREAERLAAAHPAKQFYVVEPRYEVTSLLTRIRHEQPLVEEIPF